MKEKFEIKKEYSYKKNNKKLVNVPRNIQDIFVKSVKDKYISIHTLRIFSVILSRIKGNEIKDKNQYSLFSDEFLFNEKTAIRFHYKLSDFAPKNTTSYIHVKTALKELLKYEIDQPKTIKGDNGKNIDFYGGMIFNLVMEDKGRVSFDMNAYWYCRFLYTANNFNKQLVDLFFKSKDVKDIAFYTYLLQVPGGTNIKLTTLNEKFNLNYNHYSEMERDFLKPMREKFNRISDVSFNYSKFNKEVIIIKPYKTNEKQEQPTKQVSVKQTNKRIYNRLNYIKKKHKLEEVEVNILKSLFEKYNVGFIDTIIKNNKKLFKDLKGQDFINKLYDVYKVELSK